MNSTEFDLVRRALRTLFADDDAGSNTKHQFKRPIRSALRNEHDSFADKGYEVWGEWDDH